MTEKMREALEKISAMQYENRSTVSEATAWSAFKDLNERICKIFAIADAALSKQEGECLSDRDERSDEHSTVMVFGDLFHGCSENWVRDSYRWRGVPLMGEHAHWCPDWDDLPIDESSLEWPCPCSEGDAARALKQEGLVAGGEQVRSEAQAERANTTRDIITAWLTSQSTLPHPYSDAAVDELVRALSSPTQEGVEDGAARAKRVFSNPESATMTDARELARIVLQMGGR